MNNIRFAPLIRVSTEGQERKGESLTTQTKQIQQYVKSLGGIIPEYCWQYSGQEHATPDQERTKLDRLLQDSSKGLFDAVIVCDTSRWSRDNQKSKEGLNILRENKIRFFVGMIEYDLFNPEHNFMLGMSAEVGELQARQQSMKSIINRIERAKRNIPTSGKLPYGRIFDKNTETWRIDEDKKKKIEWAAGRYLAGESIVTIAASLEMNFSNFWKILTQRSGDKWQIKFRSKKLNINETLSIKIPCLLDEPTIKLIKERAESNKTYTHGEIKNKYLLSRMIFCSKCGYALMGQTNHHGNKRYYRHPRHRKNSCDLKKWVPADLIETAILMHLLKMFGDVNQIKKAIERAIPDKQKIEKMRNEFSSISKSLSNVSAGKKNIIKAVEKGLLTDEEVDQKMSELRKKESAFTDRINQINLELEQIPSPEKVERHAKMMIAAVKQRTQSGVEHFILKKGYDDKRKLVEHAFAGKDNNGKRLGVYVESAGDEERPFTFEIRGLLESSIKGLLPLDELDFMELLDIDMQYTDGSKEIQSFCNKSNFAYYLPAPGLLEHRFPQHRPQLPG